MPGMPGMPGMGGPGGGMPSMKDLEKMKDQLPPGFDNVDLSKLNFPKK